jgi:hypothetical protein
MELARWSWLDNINELSSYTHSRCGVAQVKLGVPDRKVCTFLIKH